MAEVCCTKKSDKHYDTTGMCNGGRHDDCSGTLFAATGFHWWCACACHPEPVIDGLASRPADAERALATFHAYRQVAART